MNRSRITGFSLIEALVVMAIAGVLAAFAMPSMVEMMATGKVRAAAEEMQISMSYARSEAMKRGVNATIVPVGGDYAAGWTVESNSNVLKTVAAHPQLMAMAADTVTYRPDGRIANAAQVDIQFRHTSLTNIPMRCVSAQISGKPLLTRDTNGDPTDGCN